MLYVPPSCDSSQWSLERILACRIHSCKAFPLCDFSRDAAGRRPGPKLFLLMTMNMLNCHDLTISHLLHFDCFQNLRSSHLEEAFATLVAEVGPFVVVLFPGFDKYEFWFYISWFTFNVIFAWVTCVGSQNPCLWTLFHSLHTCGSFPYHGFNIDQDYFHADILVNYDDYVHGNILNAPGQVLLQVTRSCKALFAELTLPWFVFVVHSVDVHSHVVPPHEHLVALKDFKINIGCRSCGRITSPSVFNTCWGKIICEITSPGYIKC